MLRAGLPRVPGSAGRAGSIRRARRILLRHGAHPVAGVVAPRRAVPPRHAAAPESPVLPPRDAAIPRRAPQRRLPRELRPGVRLRLARSATRRQWLRATAAAHQMRPAVRYGLPDPPGRSARADPAPP